jgi:hypothetical protein
MLHTQQVEELITLVSTLDRIALLGHFQRYPASFPVDFTSDFLNGQPVERLRHLFVAICLQSQKMPETPAGETTEIV